jgi:hypothetical protein
MRTNFVAGAGRGLACSARGGAENVAAVKPNIFRAPIPWSSCLQNLKAKRWLVGSLVFRLAIILEAVRRELHEEAGIHCGAVRYLVSQPWPFGGSQLMIACVADALGDDITLDTNELEDAMWVTRDEARLALAGDQAARFKAPPPFAIAHTLLQRWVDT